MEPSSLLKPDDRETDVVVIGRGQDVCRGLTILLPQLMRQRESAVSHNGYQKCPQSIPAQKATHITTHFRDAKYKLGGQWGLHAWQVLW